MDRWALVTGASSGIGREIAKRFAADGISTVLVGRDEGKLAETAREFPRHKPMHSRMIACDLARASSVEALVKEVSDLPIHFVVNNAGFGWQGEFAAGEVKISLDMMRTNMEALVHLTHAMLPAMLQRKSGRILNVASTAAFQPGPLTAIYYASKAFVFSFSVALREELRGTGIEVTTLCPGFTRTAFQQRAGMKQSVRGFSVMSAEEVARVGYEGMLRGKGVVVPGALNRLATVISPMLPAGFTARIVRRMNESK